MHRFLELYQEARSPKLPARQFRQVVGEEITDALLRADVLRRCPVASRYPCEGGRLECPRRVVPNTGHPRFPWVAVCALAFPACAEVPLTEAGLEEYRTSHDRFASLVRRLLDIRGSFAMLDATYSDTVHLGEIHDASGVCDAFLSLATWDRSLSALLAERALLPRRSVVFVPTSRGVSLDLIHRHPPGSHVTLAFLVNVLGARGGELVVLPAFGALFRSRAAPEPAFCVMYTSEGARELTRTEYDDVLTNASEFDLFVDAVLPREGRKYAEGRRLPGERFEWQELSRHEAHVIAELVARGPQLVRAISSRSEKFFIPPERWKESGRAARALHVEIDPHDRSGK